MIFTSRRTPSHDAEYEALSARMVELVRDHPGFVEMTSVRDPHTREGVTVAYFTDEASVRAWKAQVEHAEAQRRGIAELYEAYRVTVAHVVRGLRLDAGRAGGFAMMRLTRRSAMVLGVALLMLAGAASPARATTDARRPPIVLTAPDTAPAFSTFPLEVTVPPATTSVRRTGRLSASRDGVTFVSLSTWRVARDGRKSFNVETGESTGRAWLRVTVTGKGLKPQVKTTSVRITNPYRPTAPDNADIPEEGVLVTGSLFGNHPVAGTPEFASTVRLWDTSTSWNKIERSPWQLHLGSAGPSGRGRRGGRPGGAPGPRRHPGVGGHRTGSGERVRRDRLVHADDRSGPVRGLRASGGEQVRGTHRRLPDLERGEHLGVLAGDPGADGRPDRPGVRGHQEGAARRDRGRRLHRLPLDQGLHGVLPRVPDRAGCVRLADRRVLGPPVPDVDGYAEGSDLPAGHDEGRPTDRRGADEADLGDRDQLRDHQPGHRRARPDHPGRRDPGYVSRTYLDSLRFGIARSYWYAWTPEYRLLGIQMWNGYLATRAYAATRDWVVGSTFSGCSTTGVAVLCNFDRDQVQFYVAYTDDGSVGSIPAPSGNHGRDFAGRRNDAGGRADRDLRDPGEGVVKGISTFLWFDDRALEAADFYVSVFPNSRILGDEIFDR